jgi:hypothetical protein
VAVPFKCEGGKMLIHMDDGSWECQWEDDVANLWSDIEDEAFSRVDDVPYYEQVVPDRPTIQAVVLIESKGGKRRTKPLGLTPSRKT